MAEAIAPKRKRSSSDIGPTPKWDNCLCHVKAEVRGKLTNFTDTSWRKFKECSNIRKDEIWLLMGSYWNEGPKGGYHRQCYQKYTNLVDVIRSRPAMKDLATSSSSTSDESLKTSEPPIKRLCRSQQPVFKKDKCLICQQDKFLKTRNHAKTREKLAQNISEYGSSAILRAAQIRNDTRVLLHIEGKDTIALEIKYHRSCYKDYVRQEKLSKLEDKSCEIEDSSSECYKVAFEEVQKYVHREVIIGEKVVSMSALLELFISQLSQQDVEASTNYRSSKLKQRLRRSFADSLSFRQPSAQNEAELVFSSSIDKHKIIENLYSTSFQVPDEVTDPENQLGSDETAHQVFHASKIIRRVLLDIKPTMKWPPTLQDLDTENEIVPDLLYNMLTWIISSKAQFSESRVTNLPPEVNRQVLSIAQDMIHCVSRGRVKTPKHVVLPMAVKSLTGNAEVVTLLNRFGHALSYSQIEELETAIAERQIERQTEGILLPSVCNPGVPAIFCWDNNDLQEETLSGKGTTHCTNGIIIQRKPLTCAPPPVTNSDRPRSKKRTVEGINSDVLPYHSGQRQGPSPIQINATEILQTDPGISKYARVKDFGWLLCRQPLEDTLFILSDEKQVIPAWAAFNESLEGGNIPRECCVGYCPVIEASPTELPTVYTVLQRSMDMADQLDQEDVIVVFDQTIYAKALEIMWQNEQRFHRLVIRMGAFHVTCAYLAAIGKRFADAGLSDILIESGVVATGSVAGVLEGRHYNRAVRLHKVMK